QSSLLHPRHTVGQTRPRHGRVGGQQRHPHGSVLVFGQPNEDLVLGQADAVLLAQLLVQLRAQQLGTAEVAAPRSLVHGRQPAGLSHHRLPVAAVPAPAAPAWSPWATSVAQEAGIASLPARWQAMRASSMARARSIAAAAAANSIIAYSPETW